jgi:hypothetical protein
MQLLKYQIKTYVTKEIHERVAKEAMARNCTMGRIIRDGITEYFLLREELANAIESPGNIGDSHTGKIIHTLLARSEQRSALLIEQLEKRLVSVYEQLDFLITMIDRFYINLMQYLPEIADKLKNHAIISSKIRHTQWLSEINKILANRNIS